MDLVAARDRRSLEEGQSYMTEGAYLGRPGCKILSPDKREVCAWGTKSNPITLVVGPHAGEIIATCNVALEVIDIRRFHSRSWRLIVAPIFVQPGNRVGIGTPIRWNTIRHRRVFLGR